MIILGIDPGIAIVGYGVIENNAPSYRHIEHGCITTPAGMDTEKRLEIIFKSLNELIKKYNPGAVAIEELFFNTNQKTGIVVAEARGVILLCCRLNGIPICEFTPLQVKQSVVGYGRAEKNQVIEMTRLLLKLNAKPKPDDAADALAIAICCANSSLSRIGKLIGKV